MLTMFLFEVIDRINSFLNGEVVKRVSFITHRNGIDRRLSQGIVCVSKLRTFILCSEEVFINMENLFACSAWEVN